MKCVVTFKIEAFPSNPRVNNVSKEKLEDAVKSWARDKADGTMSWGPSIRFRIGKFTYRRAKH